MIEVFSPITGKVYSANGDRKQWSPKLNELKEAIENDYLIRYLPIAMGNSVAVECTISDKKTGRSITRLAEEEEGKPDKPITRLYNIAFLMAASAFLKLKPAEDATMSDDEVLLFGSLKGMRYGDVKAEGAFAHFLGQIKQTENLSFPNDAQKQAQLVKLKALIGGGG